MTILYLSAVWPDYKHQHNLNFCQELKAFVLANRPFSKMAAENSNRSILKTYTSTRKNTFSLVPYKVSDW